MSEQEMWKTRALKAEKQLKKVNKRLYLYKYMIDEQGEAIQNEVRGIRTRLDEANNKLKQVELLGNGLRLMLAEEINKQIAGRK
ncbi:MAG: hypothetical protein DRP08_01765 [Candidatus Aenigmatarchaeota archaeon]|nr:MAG: hypothetical protein DRP08_01765 [Candidatus Aenigmarchaeota archaeon]